MSAPTGVVAHEWRVWHGASQPPTLYSVQVRCDGAWYVWLWDHRVGYWDQACPHDAAGRRLAGQGFSTEQAAQAKAQAWTLTCGGRRWQGEWTIAADERGIAPAEHARWRVISVDPLPAWMTGAAWRGTGQYSQLAQDAGSTRVWPERLRRLAGGAAGLGHGTVPLDAAGEPDV